MHLPKALARLLSGCNVRKRGYSSLAVRYVLCLAPWLLQQGWQYWSVQTGFLISSDISYSDNEEGFLYILSRDLLYPILRPSQPYIYISFFVPYSRLLLHLKSLVDFTGSCSEFILSLENPQRVWNPTPHMRINRVNPLSGWRVDAWSRPTCCAVHRGTWCWW